MSSRRARGRTRRGGLTVAVVGVSSPAGMAIGRALVEAAAAPAPGSVHRIGTVIGVDTVESLVGGIHHREADLDGPGLAPALAGADVVVHVAVGTDFASDIRQSPQERRERTIRRAQAVTMSAAAVGASHLVVVTSAMVLGAEPGNPIPLPDDSPVAAGHEGTVGDLVEVERLLETAAAASPGLTVTSLRPAALVGPAVDTITTRHFEAPRLLVVKGTRPAWQFCHVEDLGSATATVVAHRLAGPVTAGAEGWLDQAEVERLSGMRKVEVGRFTATATAERLHRVGVLPAPASDLAFTIHPWVVASTRLREVGWRPGHTNAACLAVVLEDAGGRYAVAARRLGGRDAAMGAASAAVALVGTAAMLRRRRRT